VTSRAGWPDELRSDPDVATLGRASMLHAGGPTVVVIGAGARPMSTAALAINTDIPEPQGLGART